MQLQFGSPVAVHNGRSLSCTGLYEVTAKIVPQVFVDLDGTLHMTHARDSNIVSFPRLILSYIFFAQRSAQLIGRITQTPHDERIAGDSLSQRTEMRASAYAGAQPRSHSIIIMFTR